MCSMRSMDLHKCIGNKQISSIGHLGANFPFGQMVPSIMETWTDWILKLVQTFWMVINILMTSEIFDQAWNYLMDIR